MKKIGLIALALVLSLGLMGAGLAYWTETLTINGVVATGELDVEFTEQWSNDDGTQKDPSECGSWDFGTIPPTWTGGRYDYHVATTTCELVLDNDPNSPEYLDKQTLTITIDNAYPCYYGNVAFTIDNIGSIPAHIESIKLVSVSKGAVEIAVDVPLEACKTYYVDADSGMVTLLTSPTGPADFSIHLSELAVCQEIPVDGALPGDICIHIEPGAEESTDPANPVTYDFTIEIGVTQFNAAP